MAHIFNIFFNYQLLTYNAMVSVRRTAFFTEYTLQHLNEDIIALLPATKLISTAPGHFFFENHPDYASTELTEAIIKAVADHVRGIAV